MKAMKRILSCRKRKQYANVNASFKCVKKFHFHLNSTDQNAVSDNARFFFRGAVKAHPLKNTCGQTYTANYRWIKK